MDIHYHPDDDLLLARAGGSLGLAPRLVLDSHLELCPHCRDRARTLDVLGGVLLDELAPADMASDALARTLARIDAVEADEAAVRRVLKVSAPPPLPQGASWPRALVPYSATPWRWVAPGMRWSRVDVPGANVFLLRIGAGKYLPQHTHNGMELTQVLYGRFHDGRALFGPGDLDTADADIHHQPVVQDGSECICLASLDGRLRFDGIIARVFGAMVGM